ncbi:MAG: hypothetical protein K1X28_09525 [Parachlamydiales bacterium]|nr:hypothetical protein [Parachlamydiales bacterium]
MVSPVGKVHDSQNAVHESGKEELIQSAVDAIANRSLDDCKSSGIDPSRVISVYQPKIALPKELVALHRHDIEKLKMRGNVIGIGAVQDKSSGAIELVYIEVNQKETYDKYRFIMKNLEGDVYGYADVKPYLHGNRPDGFGNRDDFFPDVIEERYGDEKETKLNKVKMDALQNLWRSKKYVGVLLTKAILQYYLKKGCEARMDLSAGYTSHGFYYKLGLRAHDAETNKKIAAALAEKRGTSDLQARSMFLPKVSREQWMKIIEADPIGFPDSV